MLVALGLVAQDDVIKVDVDLVNVLCTVHGKNNALIGGLEKADFHLLEDGKEQEIKYFTRETDLPLTIGLLVDVSGSQERLIDTEHRAASAFFRSVLRPKDLAFIISFGKDSELLQDSTSSPTLLEDGLKQLRLSVRVGGLHPGPVPTAQNHAGTVLWDAIYLAANERLKSEAGRKVIVVITDGVDEGSRMTRDQATREAQLADTVVYSIDYSDPGAYGRRLRVRRRRRRSRAEEDFGRNRRTRFQSGPQEQPRGHLQADPGRDAQPVCDRLFAYQSEEGRDPIGSSSSRWRIKITRSRLARDITR